MKSCARCSSIVNENETSESETYEDARESESDENGDERGARNGDARAEAETRDEYGFALTPSVVTRPSRRGRKMERSQRAKARDKKFWNRVRANAGALKEDGEAAKRAIRRGVPRDLRRDVWYLSSGASEMRANAPSTSYYEQLLMMKVDEKVTDQIELDLARTFPENENYERGNGTVGQGGNDVLRRILFAYARHNRTTGYCQGMNYIAAFIWIVIGDEERAFWTFATLLDGVLPGDVHASDIKGTIAQYKILHRILESQAPKIARHLRAVDVDLVMIASKWLLCLFVESLPALTAARVLDCVLAEGEKVWFRVVIAMLRLHEREILACQTMPDVMVALKDVYRRQTDADELLNFAFKNIRLSRKTILNHRVSVRRAMNEEAERRAVELAANRKRTAAMEAARKAQFASPEPNSGSFSP